MSKSFFKLFSFILLGLSLISAQQSLAQEGEKSKEAVCALAKTEEPTLVEKYLENGEIQEAIWQLSKEGRKEEAQELKRKMRLVMEKGQEKNFQFLGGGKHASFKATLCGRLTDSQEEIFKKDIDVAYKTNEFMNYNIDINNEVAAYELDQLFGFDLVPMTVFRKVNDKMGSVQYFVKNATVAKKLIPENLHTFNLINIYKKLTKNENFTPELTKQMKLLNLFDYLIQGTDRNPGNYLVKNNRLMAIDHTWAFRNWDFYHNRFKFGWGLWNVAGKNIEKFIPNKEVYLSLKNTPDKEIRKRMKKFLKAKEVNNIILRKREFVRQIDRLIKKKGEESVFAQD